MRVAPGGAVGWGYVLGTVLSDPLSRIALFVGVAVLLCALAAWSLFVSVGPFVAAAVVVGLAVLVAVAVALLRGSNDEDAPAAAGRPTTKHAFAVCVGRAQLTLAVDGTERLAVPLASITRVVAAPTLALRLSDGPFVDLPCSISPDDDRELAARLDALVLELRGSAG